MKALDLKIGDKFHISPNPKCQVKSTRMEIIPIPEDMKEDYKGLVLSKSCIDNNSHFAWKQTQIVYKHQGL